MNMSMDFKKVHNKILGHMKAFDVTVDHILVHFVGSKLGLYVSFRIPLYYSIFDLYAQRPRMDLNKKSLPRPKTTTA